MVFSFGAYCALFSRADAKFGLQSTDRIVNYCIFDGFRGLRGFA